MLLFFVQKSRCCELARAGARVGAAGAVGRLRLCRRGRIRARRRRLVPGAAEEWLDVVGQVDLDHAPAEELGQEAADAVLVPVADLPVVDRQTGRDDLLERHDSLHWRGLVFRHEIAGELDAELERVDRVDEALHLVQATEPEVAAQPVLAHHEVALGPVVARDLELLHPLGHLGDVVGDVRVLHLPQDPTGGLE